VEAGLPYVFEEELTPEENAELNRAFEEWSKLRRAFIESRILAAPIAKAVIANIGGHAGSLYGTPIRIASNSSFSSAAVRLAGRLKSNLDCI
jgi:hypothetical protein